MLKVTKNHLIITGLLFFCFTVLFMALPTLAKATTPQIAAGGTHTIVIKSNGTLWGWGLNNMGQLGIGEDHPGADECRNTQYGTTCFLSPIQISTDHDWVAIETGYSYTIALKSDGRLYAWGLNNRGQLGVGNSLGTDCETQNGTAKCVFTPVQVGTETDWDSIAVISWHTLALKSDGRLYAWGLNRFGELGLGEYEQGEPCIDGKGGNLCRFTPEQVGTETDWDSVATGGYHSLALKSDGRLYAWGRNDYGQVGIGENNPPPEIYSCDNGTKDCLLSPEQVGTETDWDSVKAGAWHTIALKSDGSLYTWGRNNRGQLGDGTKIGKNFPEQVGTETDWDSIVARMAFTLALKSDGTGGKTLWAWGSNGHGELGHDDTDDRDSPEQVGTETDWDSVKAGYYHTLALKAEGTGGKTLWAWGWNWNGQLGEGINYYDYTSRLSPVPITCLNKLPAKIGDTYYSTLQEAYNDAVDGNTIEAQAIIFTEDNDEFNINRDISVTLQSGYNDCDFTPPTGSTSILGQVRVSSGTLIISSGTLRIIN